MAGNSLYICSSCQQDSADRFRLEGRCVDLGEEMQQGIQSLPECPLTTALLITCLQWHQNQSYARSILQHQQAIICLAQYSTVQQTTLHISSHFSITSHIMIQGGGAQHQPRLTLAWLVQTVCMHCTPTSLPCAAWSRSVAEITRLRRVQPRNMFTS